MKKLIGILAVIALFTVSCTKDISSPEENEADQIPAGEKVGMIFNASFEPASKATLEGVKVNWQATDEIAVYDGTAVNRFTVKSCEGNTAVFEGEVTSGAKSFYAVYPYSAASAAQPSGGKVTFTVPSDQIVDANGVAPDALVCIAEASEGKFSFKNAVSIVKIHIDETDIQSVTMEGFTDEMISGETSSAAGENPAAGTSKTVTIRPAEGTFAAGDYSFAIIPTSFSAGFRLSLNLAEGKNLIQTDKTAEFGRNTLRMLNTTNAVKIPYVIRTADDMLNFSKNISKYSASDVVKLTSDIDMNNSWTYMTSMSCTLDGQGHKVSGISLTTTSYRAGLIGTLNSGAVLRNLVLGSSDGSSSDRTSAVTYKGTVAAYLGGVVSDCQGLVENVKSFVGVNYACTAKVDCHIGGICGNVGGNGRITGCEFAGGMTINDNASGGTRKAGGITGRMHDKLADAQTIKDCSFTGVITNEDSRMEGVGGIVGHMQGGNIVSCISNGRINMNYNGATGYVGGVVGYYQSYASSYTSEVSLCTNSTVIESTQRVLAAAGIVGYIQRGATGPLTVSGCINNADICLKTAPTAMTCLGGIIGYSQKLSATDMLKVKLTVKDNTNNGKIECNISGTASTLNMGGICGYVSGTVAFEIGGNTNNGNVTINGKLVRTGGIVGWLNSPDAVVFGNVNRGALSQTNSDKMSACGGIIGYGENSLSMSDNFNSGSVTISCPTASDNYAAGLIGQFNGSSSSGSPNVLNITNDRSIGAISSPGRAGVIFSALSGGTYVTCNLNNVGIGGSKNGTGVTADNYGNHLWSYTNSTYHKVTGAASCKYVSE